MTIDTTKPPYVALATILRKAQNRIDAETDDAIDIGGEVIQVREWCDNAAREIREARAKADA